MKNKAQEYPCTPFSPGSMYIVTVANTSSDDDWFRETRIDLVRYTHSEIWMPKKDQEEFLWKYNIGPDEDLDRLMR